MIRGWSAVYHREALILRRRGLKTLASMCVSPLLYLLAFGWAMSGTLGDSPCLRFLVPGFAAMSSMTQSWAIAADINIARFYWRIFDEIQSAPVAPMGYVLGEMLAGMTRGLAAAALTVGLGLALACGRGAARPSGWHWGSTAFSSPRWRWGWPCASSHTRIRPC